MMVKKGEKHYDYYYQTRPVQERKNGLSSGASYLGIQIAILLEAVESFLCLQESGVKTPDVDAKNNMF